MTDRFSFLTIVLVACAHATGSAGAVPADDGFPTASRTAPTPPSLVIDAQSVSVDGVKVADARALAELEAGAPGALVKALKDRPFFTPDISFAVKPGASTRAASHALQGAWAARYTKVHFVGSDVVAANGPILVPPPTHTILRLGLEADAARLSWATDVPCDRAPHGSSVAGAEVVPSIARGCGDKPCIDEAKIAATDDVPFARVVAAIGAASKQGTPDFRFTLGVGKKLPDEPDVCGERIVTMLAQEEIQRIVRADFGAIGGCYDDALKRDPTAGGRMRSASWSSATAA
jgi:hypothetical protein